MLKRFVIVFVILSLFTPIEVFGAYQYTIVYKAEGKVISTQYIQEGEDAEEPEPPEIEGKIFKCWSSKATGVKRNMVIKAIYTREGSESSDTEGSQDEVTNSYQGAVTGSPADALVAATRGGSGYIDSIEEGNEEDVEEEELPVPGMSTDNTERSIEEVEDPEGYAKKVAEEKAKVKTKREGNKAEFKEKSTPKTIEIEPIKIEKDVDTSYKYKLMCGGIGAVTLLVCAVILVYYAK